MTAVAGWYADPSGAPGKRYWDGQRWASTLPAPQGAGVVVTGPNHAVHAILTLLTFWACGGWVWIWLIVAMQNRQQVRQVDAYGNVIVRPPTPAQVTATEANRRTWAIGAAVFIGLFVALFVILAISTPH